VVCPQNHWDGLSVVWLQNYSDGFFRFGLKICGDGFSGLTSKPVATDSWLSLKTKVVEGFPVWASKLQLRFGDLSLKITATISWFGPQNQSGFGLSIASQNRQSKVGMGHVLAACFTWKQVGQGFPSLASRLVETRRRVVHVAPSRRLREQVEDGRVDVMGCVGPCYPCFAIFLVLGPRGIVVFLVFCFGL
jgi:hypothetical protein